MLKLWVRIGSLEDEYQLAHERVVELFDLAYLGPFVRTGFYSNIQKGEGSRRKFSLEVFNSPRLFPLVLSILKW